LTEELLTEEITKQGLSKLGENIRYAINISNYKPIEVAKLLNVDRSAVSLWVSGKRTPTAKNIIELAKILKIDIAILWSGVATVETSEQQKKLLFLSNKLSKSQLELVNGIIESMLPPPEIQEIVETISDLNSEQQKALLAFAKSSKI